MVAIITLITITLTASKSWFTSTSSSISLTVVEPTVSDVSSPQAFLPSVIARRQNEKDICESNCYGELTQGDRNQVIYDYCMKDCSYGVEKPAEPIVIPPISSFSKRSVEGYEECAARCEKDNHVCYQLCRELHISPIPNNPDKWAPVPDLTPGGTQTPPSIVVRDSYDELCGSLTDTRASHKACGKALSWPRTNGQVAGLRTCLESCRQNKMYFEPAPYEHGECLTHCGVVWTDPYKTTSSAVSIMTKTSTVTITTKPSDVPTMAKSSAVSATVKVTQEPTPESSNEAGDKSGDEFNDESNDDFSDEPSDVSNDEGSNEKSNEE